MRILHIPSGISFTIYTGEAIYGRIYLEPDVFSVLASLYKLDDNSPEYKTLMNVDISQLALLSRLADFGIGGCQHGDYPQLIRTFQQNTCIDEFVEI